MSSSKRYAVDRDGCTYYAVGRGRFRMTDRGVFGDDWSQVRTLNDREVMVMTKVDVYVITHRCVLEVACPQCNAPIRRCCIGAHGPKSETHYRRRNLARQVRGER